MPVTFPVVKTSNVSRCWQMSWGDTPGWEPLTLRVATVYKDPPSTLPGHPVLKSLYSVMVLFLKFQTKGQRAKTMSSQPQPPYQLWPLPCTLLPCLCSCGSLSFWRYLPVLVRGPLQTRTMAPKSRSQLEHTLTVTVVRCVCVSPTLTPRPVSTVFPELSSGYTHSWPYQSQNKPGRCS